MSDKLNVSDKMHDTVTALATPSTYAGAVFGGVGALTLAQWLAIGGFILAALGFLVNVWFKWQMVRLRRAELALEAEQKKVA